MTVRAGHYLIKSCKLSNFDNSKSIDISNLIYRFELSEGIFQQVIQARLYLYDTLDLIGGFPLIGEEGIFITIQDFYGEDKSYLFHVNSIGPITTNVTSTGQDYSLELFTREYVISEANEIREAFVGSPATISKDIHAKYLQTSKPFNYEFTSTSGTYVIPAMTPFETIDFLSRKSYSQTNKSSYFYFFETRDDYKFTTMEQLIKDGRSNIKEFNYIDPTTVGKGTDQEFIMQNLISYRVEKRFNTLAEMRTGASVSRTFLIDLSKKTYEEFEYKHYENENNLEKTDGNFAESYHTGRFNQNIFSDKNIIESWIVFKDTTKLEDYYKEILPLRNSSEYFMDSIAITAKLHGRWSMNVGDMVRLTLPRSDAGDENLPDTGMDGDYLVESLNHTYNEDGWEIEMKLIKNALKDG